MYHVFDGLQDILDGDLDEGEAERIEAQLAVAKRSDRDEIASLATILSLYLEREKGRFPVADYSYWKRTAIKVDTIGQRLGRRAHRIIISGILIFWLILVIAYIAILTPAGVTLDE